MIGQIIVEFSCFIEFHNIFNRKNQGFILANEYQVQPLFICTLSFGASRLFRSAKGLSHTNSPNEVAPSDPLDTIQDLGPDPRNP